MQTEPSRPDPGPNQNRAQDQALLDFAVSVSPVIFFTAELQDAMVIKFISANVETLIGHRPDLFIARSDYRNKLVHPEDQQHYLDRLRGLRSAEQVSIEYRFKNRDGSYHWYRDELRITKGNSDGPDDIVGCMIDITNEKKQQMERDRRARIVDEALESLPTGITISDSDGKIILCNSAAVKRLGYSRQAAMGRSLEDLWRQAIPDIQKFGDRSLTDSEADFAHILMTHNKASGEPIEIQLKDGTWVLRSWHRTNEGATVSVRTDITKQKVTEIAITEREHHYRTLVEESPLPISLIDLETSEILYRSPATVKMFGLNPSPDKVENVRNYNANPADRDRFNALIKKHGEVKDFEFEAKRTDGSVFWASNTSRLITIDGKHLIYASVKDLTEVKNREKELRQAHEILQDAIEALPEGIVIWDQNDQFVTCNKRYLEINRISAKALKPGVTWRQFIYAGAKLGQYADAIGRVDAWVKSRVATRHVGNVAEYQLSDGRWVKTSSHATRQGGRVATRLDVTERKKMEDNLRESENLIRRILEACPLPLSMSRLSDGQYIYVSPANVDLLGIGRQGGPTSVADTFIDPEDLVLYIDKLKKSGGVDGLEVQCIRADGTPFWAAMSSRLITYKNQEVIVSSLYDLTERRASEAELTRQREALYQSEKLNAFGTLLAGVAHELNNPLSVVSGQALLLLETVEDPRISERAVKIGNAAERCTRIVRTFLAMAREDTREMSSVNLNEVVLSVLEITGYTVRQSNVQITRRLSKDLPRVRGNADQLHQVATNLIVNAQQALDGISAPRQISITTRYNRKTDEIVLRIRDNGPGIPSDIRKNVFDPFFTTKKMGSGTGIGLAVSHQIVESHGGRIDIESPRDGGVSLVVRLPASTPPGDVTQNVAVHSKTPAPCRALVVDDEPDVADLLADILRVDGHNVVTAATGQEALDQLDAMAFDIILSDLRLPGLDGPSLFKIIREQRPELQSKIGFITGDTMSQNIYEFLKSAGRPYIEKPITPDDVRGLLEQLITNADGLKRRH